MRAKDRPSPLQPAGEGKGLWLATLEQGANLLQEPAPLAKFDVYVVGFHPAKDDPSMQMEAHHFCRVVNDDFIQAALFDGNTETANLIGIEYIISERLFETLPAEERAYWHPHNFEILSGQARRARPARGRREGADEAAHEQLRQDLAHLAHRPARRGRGHTLPLGDPMLMWSFNRDGECDPALEQDREAAMDLDTPRTREQRQDLVEQAHPQHGVDALAGRFPGATPVPGVVDVGAAGSAGAAG